MNRNSIIIKCISLLETSYPNFYTDFNETKIKLLIETWIDAVEEYPEIDLLPKATKRAISKSDFPPSLKKIIDEFKRFYTPENIYDVDSAWAELQYYLRNYNHYSETHPKLSEMTQKTVSQLGGSYTLRMMSEYEIGQIRGKFDTIYKSILDSEIQKRIELGEKTTFFINIKK